jgi:hypothetical protein
MSKREERQKWKNEKARPLRVIIIDITAKQTSYSIACMMTSIDCDRNPVMQRVFFSLFVKHLFYSSSYRKVCYHRELAMREWSKTDDSFHFYYCFYDECPFCLSIQPNEEYDIML